MEFCLRESKVKDRSLLRFKDVSGFRGKEEEDSVRVYAGKVGVARVHRSGGIRFFHKLGSIIDSARFSKRCGVA